LNPQNPVWAKV